MMAMDVALVEQGVINGSSDAAYHAMSGMMFEEAMLYSESFFDHTFILSPTYGLLEPLEVIDAVGDSLWLLGPTRVYGWARNIVASLRTLFPCTHLSICILSSDYWAHPIIHYLNLEVLPYWDWIQPLKGLSYQERLRWFQSQEELHDPNSRQ